MSSIVGAESERPLRTGRIEVDTHAMALAVAREAQKRKGQDIVVLDLRALTGVCDYFIIITGQSDTQIRAITDQIEDGMKEHGHRVWHIEGYSTGRWVLLDFVDVVVHVFHPDARELYQLEKLWRDAGREEIADD